jgi:predicted naringenin-chalcone synthase
VHPGGAAILESLERSLELPAPALAPSRSVLSDFGNMSSPTIWFILRKLLADDAIEGPGVAIAFGPGLSVEAALLEKTR